MQPRNWPLWCSLGLDTARRGDTGWVRHGIEPRLSRHTFLLTIRNRDKLALTARLRCELLPCYVGDSDISASQSQMREILMLDRKLAAIIGFAVAAVMLGGCSSDGETNSTAIVKNPDGKGKTLTLWHYEDLESAMGHAWTAAIAEFEKTTGATVKFEAKSYEGIRSTASQVLNSSSALDVLEYTKGNGTAGLLSSQGLLTDLDAAAKLYGWDKELSPSLQTTARYNDKGIMGTGPFYGIPNYGEFTEVYYNKDMFDRYGLSVPTTIADFENVLKTFKDAGITPLAESATEYPLGQLWYQLALSRANRQWVTNFQTFAEPVDFHDSAFTYATQTIKDWVDKGYI